MASGTRKGGMAAPRDGFLSFKTDLNPSGPKNKKKKQLNKNKKKSWGKHSDVRDVEEFLEDVRFQERTVGGLISEKPDDSLFFVDAGGERRDSNLDKDKPLQDDVILQPDSRIPAPTDVSSGLDSEKPDGSRHRKDKPLRIDVILQSDSRIPAPKDVLAHQIPNAKKLRVIAQRAQQLEARGVVPRQQRLLQARLQRSLARKGKANKPAANNDPQRGFYDLWSGAAAETADPWYLQQTKKMLVKRPARLNVKPSTLPAVEVPAPGASYNPDFLSHQALLRQGHEIELKKQKAELRLERQLAFPKEQIATRESVFQEEVEGLIEDSEDEGPHDEYTPQYQAASREKKTERQRKWERQLREREKRWKALRQARDRQQQLFRLRSLKAEVLRQEETTGLRKEARRAKKLEEESMPRRLGKLKYQEPDLDLQLSSEMAGSLRKLKPEGSILKDRFKSLQKRNLIEPRERAKFVRKHKLKYVEKRAFREVTL
ncbi:ribosome biogenesis protein NOP53 [Polyodon spathula]|uniref:ribosome biogenesis protein NOP53 n=1 Tax=Polyodon spathula TaxID=7913 RepID=UPI001B7ED9C7|nr:ribosome biogenesis protein NOP53 [Polyodon spathula]